MRYSKYPSYKDSGVEWLGEIPEGWTKTNLKYIADINMGQSPSSSTYNNEGIGIEFLQGNADFGDKFPTARIFTTEPKKLSNPEDILFTVRAPVGAMNIGKNKYAIGRGLCAINSTKHTKKAFLWWLMAIVKSELDTVATGSTYEAVSVEQVNNAIVLIPPLQEQKAIANYLGKATAKIDTLIEKQTKLIELLKEKRQAVISTAVTRGLDSTVAMKDSGVEWLGEIPEGWEVTPLRYIGRLQNGISKGGDYFGSGLPFVNYGDIYKNGTLPLHVKGLAKSSKEDRHVYSVLKGDVFFTRTSETIDDIGMSSTCLETIKDATFSGFTIRFRQLKRVLDENFSKYYFRTGHAQDFFEEQLNLVTRASLGQDILKQLPVLLPPLKEQQVLAAYLDNKTSKIDKLITKSDKAIDLLKEKRTALISTVVTGKIDVREFNMEST